LPDGKYMVLHGCEAFTSASGGFPARMSISINAGSALQSDECLSSTVDIQSTMRITFQTLSNNGSSSIVAKYAVDGSKTGTFGKRWLFALKYSNL
jgi:hypothetical protein